MLNNQRVDVVTMSFPTMKYPHSWINFTKDHRRAENYGVICSVISRLSTMVINFLKVSCSVYGYYRLSTIFCTPKRWKNEKHILKQWFSKVEKWSRKFFGSQHRAGHRNKDADRLSVVVVLQLLLGFGLEMTEPTFQPNVCHTLLAPEALSGGLFTS